MGKYRAMGGYQATGRPNTRKVYRNQRISLDKESASDHDWC
ncbi:unnamed protein product [Fusarium graminearum]|nr:unnamed protein product [Fusarium graminearum]